MAKDDVADILRLLYAYEPAVREKALWLREYIWDRYPQANELIYDNYNALAFGWSPTEKMSQIFCSVAIYRVNQGIHFGFYWGAELNDRQKVLAGNGNQYRYLLVDNISNLPLTYLNELIEQAWHNSLQKVKGAKDIVHGKTILKSVAAVKRQKKNPGK